MPSDGWWTTPAGLHVHETGAGPLVVLVHGTMDRASGMLRTRRLLQREARIVRYDRRGYGRSQSLDPVDDVDRQVADLVEVLGGRPAVVVGHSFGGVLTLSLADRRPDLVRATASYESPLPWEPWWPERSASRAAATGTGLRDGDEGPAQAAEWFMRRMIGDDMWERLPPAMRADRRAEGRALLADMRSMQPPAPAPFVPERIGVPVIVAHGESGRAHHRRGAEELAARVPDAELTVVPGADHGIHLSHPEAFADIVRRTIARAGAV